MKVSVLFLLLSLLALFSVVVVAEDGGADDDDGANGNDDGNQQADDDNADGNGDDNNQAANNDDDDGDDVYQPQNYGDDYIEKWGNYALLPKRCIVYNDVDVIVFSVFDHSYKQCSDDAIGTYIIPVPTFVNAYLQQTYNNEQDKGNDDYAIPESIQYTQCTQQVIQNQEYYLQLGCTDGSSQSLSVNIYSDNTCTTRDVVDGYDDSNIDVSDIQIPFKRCQACVQWKDMSDDQIDDQFYENREMNAPLCATAWQYKEGCDRKCQKTGLEKSLRDGWNTSDKILLGILALFGAGMLGAILQKRTQMSNKDALLEQAAMSAAGLQQAHVIGIFVLVVLVVTVFALLGLKNITWALLLIVNTVLFGYLMKLTIDSGVGTGETIIGPDGQVIHRQDSDDSSIHSDTGGSTKEHANAGTYMIPSIT